MAHNLDYPSVSDDYFRDDSVAIREPSGALAEELRRFKAQLHHQLVVAMDLQALATMSKDQLRKEVRLVAEEICHKGPNLLNRQERDRLVNEVLDETFGLGPLEVLIKDPSITDILINGPRSVYVERDGRLEMTDVTFNDDAHLRHIIQRMVTQAGRRVDEASPMVDSRLIDGSRLNAVIPPVALDGALVAIRRFGVQPIRAQDLVSKQSIPQEAMDFLAGCVKARLNILISGGTGSGKTTLLNAMSAFIPSDQRIITIEDAAELKLQQSHVGRMETRASNVEGAGEISTRDLVRNALRMRPDRIIVGECRGPEALDMLQAMNTGHEGSLTTIHSNDTRDALGRLEIMVGMAGFDLPLWVIRRQIASAIQVVVQVSRLAGGLRKVVKISELTGLEGDNYAMQDLFTFKQTGMDDSRRAQGCFCVSGIRPHNLERLAAHGIEFPPNAFERRLIQPRGIQRSQVTPAHGS
jgi:pilus assembly protein CpaF